MFCVWCTIIILQACPVESITRWPDGNYGLLKPLTGCPIGHQDSGFIFQDTVDTRPSNNRSEILHIDGYVGKSEVLRYFCIRTGSTGTETEDATIQWPEGEYCIYAKKDSTETGINSRSGSIRMYDEKNNNKDSYKSTNGVVHIKKTWLTKAYDYTELHFACQTSGNKKNPIELPITKPFYLLPYGSRDCQQVKWMVATTEWIKYHTRDTSDNIRHGKFPHVEDDENRQGLTVYYCYYQSCRYSFVNKQGVFQSPGFPGKYPDGQLCSWRIMVPANHTIRVHFTSFSLNGSDTDDYLRLFIKKNDTFRLNETFHGVKQPFNVTANSDVNFLFRSDKHGSSHGFRAEYHVMESHVERQEHYTSPNIQTDISRTTPIQVTSQNKYSSAIPTTRMGNKSRAKKSFGETPIYFIVIPVLVFALIGIVLIIVIVRRCRKPASLDQSTGSTTANTTNNVSYPPLSRDDHEYAIPENVKTESTKTDRSHRKNTYPEYYELEPISDNESGQREYQTLTRDQQPEYESPDYSKQNHTTDSNMDPECLEYHELEPMDNNVPDEVMYHVLEGPTDSNMETVEPMDNNVPDEIVYHVLEGPDSENRPSNK